MKHTQSIIILIAIVCAVGLLTQCKKEIVEQTGGTLSGEMIDVFMNVDNGGDSKTDIVGRIIQWEAGDTLCVVGASDGMLGYISAQNSGGSSAYFTGSIKKSSTPSQVFNFYYVGKKANKKFPPDITSYNYSISTQTGSLGDIEDGFLLMHGVGSKTYNPGDTDLGTITMTSLMSIAHFSFTKDSNPYTGNITVSGGYATATLNIYNGTLESKVTGNITVSGTSSNRYIALIPGEQILTFGNADLAVKTVLQQKNVVVNTFYNQDSPHPVELYLGGFYGEFSIGESKKIRFSKGNLCYSSGKWQFESNQFDFRTYQGKHCCIDGTYSTTGTPNGDWGLFGWSNENTDCNYGMYSSGSHENTTFKEWGANNISIGSIYTTGWRTLTSASSGNGGEWRYLINTRSGKYNNETVTAATLRGHATINLDATNSVKGIVLLPDNFTLPEGLSFHSDSEGTAYTKNTYSMYQWSSMENAGAVFLPASGQRDGTTINNCGSDCFYWSSTCKDSSTNSTYDINLKGLDFSYDYMKKGNSVRLVCDVTSN